MGMDLVEIVVEVEERFGLRMTSQDWQSLGPKATVQTLADWVWERLPSEQKSGEQSRHRSAPLIEFQSLERAALHWRLPRAGISTAVQR